MKIVLKTPVDVGDMRVPAGEYMVSVLTDSRQVNLAGGGKDYPLPATKRQVGKKIRVTDVQYFSYGGPTWTILVKTPPNFEWVAHVNLVKGNQKKKTR